MTTQTMTPMRCRDRARGLVACGGKKEGQEINGGCKIICFLDVAGLQHWKY